MRIFKIAVFALAGVLALLLLCIALLALFFNPNDYKTQIERLVADKTGRQFTLAGDLKLSMFPWLAIEIGPATLGNAPGFGDTPMVALQQARLGVKVWPLLKGRVEIGKVSLDAPQILLMKNEQGADNWSDLGGKNEETPPPSSSSGPVSATVAGLDIRDALLTYEDKQAGSRLVVRDGSVSTGKLEPGEPFDLKTEFKLERGADLNLTAKLSGRVTADPEQSVYRLDDPSIELMVRGPSYPQPGLPVRVRAKALQADFKTQTAALTALEIDAAGAQVSTDLQVSQLSESPRFAGKLKLAPVSIREIAPRFGVKLPVMADAQALRHVSAEADITGTENSIELKPMQLKLDDTTMKGSLSVADFATRALRFNLAVDRIDADRYLPPKPTEEPKKTERSAATPPTPIPVDMLRTLNIRGELTVGEAIFNGMQFSRMRLGVNAQDSKLRLNPLQATMYEGRYQGDIALDASGKTPRLTMDEHLNGVNFAPLFKALYKTQRIAGRGQANLQINASGADTDAMKQTLNGAVDFNVKDGAFEGFDLWYEIRRARAVLKQQAIPARTGPERTPFTAMQGSGVFTNGVLDNKDLNVTMQYLKVTGLGQVNLMQSTVDYRLNAAVMKMPAEDRSADAAQDLEGLTIPVRITGTLTDPKVRPDVAGYVKEQAKQRLDEEKEKVEEKLKNKLQDKLRGILGK